MKKAVQSEKCVPAEKLDHCSYSFFLKLSESFELPSVGYAGSQTESELGRVLGKAHMPGVASGQTYDYLQLFFCASILKTVVNSVTFQRKMASSVSIILNKKVLHFLNPNYPQ